jgi:hypothetical protein
MKKFIVKAEVALWAKDKEEAIKLWKEQLEFAGFDDHPAAHNNVMEDDESTKIIDVVEVE